MKAYSIRTHSSTVNLAHEDQLAWKIAEVAQRAGDDLDGKEVVDEDVALERIAAAGAARRDPDAIFPEAMARLREFAAIRATADVPVLAKMTEFGKSQLFTTSRRFRRAPACTNRRITRNTPSSMTTYTPSTLRPWGADEQ